MTPIAAFRLAAPDREDREGSPRLALDAPDPLSHDDMDGTRDEQVLEPPGRFGLARCLGVASGRFDNI